MKFHSIFIVDSKHAATYTLSEAKITVISATTVSIFSALPPVPQGFGGRDELVRATIEHLVLGKNVALSSGGVPGIGMTTIATSIAHSPVTQARFDGGILWATVGQHPDIGAVLARWATALGVNFRSAKDDMALARAITGAIGTRRILIILDDVWSMADAQALQCGGLNCCTLLTSNYRAVAREFVEPDSPRIVRELSASAAHEMLKSLAPAACAAEHELSVQAAHATAGLPLALRLLAGYLNAPVPGDVITAGVGSASFAAVTARVPHVRLTTALGRLGTHDHSNTTLQQAIALSLTGLSAQTLRAFYDLGAFVPAPATFTREAAIAVTHTNAATIDQLIARNLIDVVPGKTGTVEQLSIHAVIAGVARVRRDPKTVARHRAHYVAQVTANRDNLTVIDDIYPQVEHAWASTPDEPLLLEMAWSTRLYQAKRGMLKAMASWSSRCKEMPFIASSTAPNSSSDDRGIELMDAVQRTMELIDDVELSSREGYELIPAINLNTQAAVMFNIGSAYDSLGRRDQALDYYARAWPLQEEAGDEAALAITLNNIGSIYYEMNLPGKALDYLKLSMKCREHLGDNGSSHFGQTLNNLGVIYTNLGLAKEAAAHFTRSLNIHIQLGDYASEATTRANLAKFHHLRGPLQDAVVHMARLVELDKLTASPELNRHHTKLLKLQNELDAEIVRGSPAIGVDTSPGSMVSSTPGNLVIHKTPEAPRSSLRKSLADRFKRTATKSQ